jgi:DNA polymerase-3 subunit delta'
MEGATEGAQTRLAPGLVHGLETGRIHSAYLLSGPAAESRAMALAFVRALLCARGAAGPCEACPSCRRSAATAEIPLDGAGKTGPLYRHVGDHPDLLWVERGAGDTRVRIGQIRALQAHFRLRSTGGDRRAAVVADADWLNPEAQNALLRLLEEPPPSTSLVLVSSSPASLLVTVRSRCQRVRVTGPPPPDLLAPDAPEAARELAGRFAGLAGIGIPALLDWAEEYRGARAEAAEGVATLLATGSAWLRARVRDALAAGTRDVERDLDAFQALGECRRALVQRNANPQMVAERALLALRGVASR